MGLSLILAIGAQNAFVLRQGIRRAHVLPVVLTCAISDALLIALGVFGLSTVTAALPQLLPILRYGGAAFLLAYGLRAFYSAWQGGAALSAEGQTKGSLWLAVATALLLTWANPHVYLDTVVLLGSVAAQHGAQSVYFGLGAVVASFVFFFSLGFGARFLAPLFARPNAWRVLDFGVGLLMWVIAFGLIFGG